MEPALGTMNHRVHACRLVAIPPDAKTQPGVRSNFVSVCTKDQPVSQTGGLNSRAPAISTGDEQRRGREYSRSREETNSSRGQRRQKAKKNEVAVTPDSRVVPHPSTKEARRSLTSEFG